jgi:hypothetical protein
MAVFFQAVDSLKLISSTNKYCIHPDLRKNIPVPMRCACLWYLLVGYPSSVAMVTD